MPKLSQKEKTLSDLSQNGFPKPKKVNCFQCGKDFFVKFVLPRQEYSQKNNWEYWTGEKGKKYICDKHLLELYYNTQNNFLFLLLSKLLSNLVSLKSR